MILTTEMKQEIRDNCLDDICEDMGFPTNEREPLSELAFMHIQGLVTCKFDTTLSDGVFDAAVLYLIDLFGETL